MLDKSLVADRVADAAFPLLAKRLAESPAMAEAVEKFIAFEDGATDVLRELEARVADLRDLRDAARAKIREVFEEAGLGELVERVDEARERAAQDDESE